jgi:hypothetical protein
MTELQEFPYDMKTVRCMAEKQIIITDEVLREAGKDGSEAGPKLRKLAEAVLK